VDISQIRKSIADFPMLVECVTISSAMSLLKVSRYHVKRYIANGDLGCFEAKSEKLIPLFEISIYLDVVHSRVIELVKDLLIETRLIWVGIYQPTEVCGTY